MPGVFKRASDKKRGKSGKYTCWWIGEDGKQKTKVGFTDKQESLDYARGMEIKCRQIREGLVDPDEERWRDIAVRPIAESLEAYLKAMEDRKNTTKHNRQTIKSINDVLSYAGIETISDITLDTVQDGLARLLESRSARTANYALVAIKSFVTWLEDSNRIDRPPRGVHSIKRYTPFVKHKRRALTDEEFGRLVEAAENGPDRLKKEGNSGGPTVDVLSGPDRAILYRIALATGFRANELRQLTPEDFNLDGDKPTITCRANNSKRGKKLGRDDVQMIRMEDAAAFKPLLAGKRPGEPVLFVPYRTAKMVRSDLKAAGIPYKDAEGRVFDFHAIRVTFITNLILTGVNPKVAQVLARHSDIKLTMDTYTKLGDDDVRRALERGAKSRLAPDGQTDGAEGREKTP